MKKNLALYALVAAALIAVPTIIRAQTPASTNAPTATAPAAKKHGVPFKGKVAAVDTTATTVTIGTKTYNVTSDTKILKDGKPATLADITVGETISGYAKKDDAGKLNATSISIGKKVKKTE
jgi:hypothetical protein